MRNNLLNSDVRPVVLLVFESARGSKRLRGIMVYEIQYVFIWPCVIRTVYNWQLTRGNQALDFISVLPRLYRGFMYCLH